MLPLRRTRRGMCYANSQGCRRPAHQRILIKAVELASVAGCLWCHESVQVGRRTVSSKDGRDFQLETIRSSEPAYWTLRKHL